MKYTEDFNGILDKQNEIRNASLFVLKNDKPEGMKVFPDEVQKTLLTHFFCNLRLAVKDNEFVQFIPDKQCTGTLQVIDAGALPLWIGMRDVRNSLPVENQNEIVVSDYDSDGNTLLMDIEFDDDTRVFFLSIYRNVAAWYSNNIRFTRTPEGKFHEEKGKILALTPYVDAVISGQCCYIINETNFTKIFKFDQVIKNQIEEHGDEIRGLNFIGNADMFMGFLDSSKRQRSAMAKVIMQKRLDKIKKYSSAYIRGQIERQTKLSFIQYDKDDRIIIDKKSFTAIVGILCGTINIDLITNQLNGLDEYE